jgi:hypothetical protein
MGEIGADLGTFLKEFMDTAAQEHETLVINQINPLCK